MNETKEKLTFVQAVTMQNDVRALYKQLSQTQAGTVQLGKSGKGGATEQIIDGKKMLQSLNSVSLVQTEQVAEPRKGFVIQLLFQPKEIGEYRANVVVYNKVGGIWVIPVVGKCTKPPALGSIAFE